MPTKVEYVWIGGLTDNDQFSRLRSKTKIIYNDAVELDDLPFWSVKGSLSGYEEEYLVIKPHSLFKDPFRKKDINYVALCDLHTYDIENDECVAHSQNTRKDTSDLLNDHKNDQPWYGISQDFFILDSKTSRPMGYPNDPGTYASNSDFYYCSRGTNDEQAKTIVDEIVDNALYAGVKISGMNAKNAPGQWKIKIGPCNGIDAGDELWMLRYIIERTVDKYNCHVDFKYKPVINEWAESYSSVKFSTRHMRRDDGYNKIKRSVNKLKKNHKKDMKKYNREEDAEFAVSIPRSHITNQSGYLEDSRPACYMDPYVVMKIIFKSSR